MGAGRISAQKSVVNASAITSRKFGKPAKRSLSSGASFESNSTAITRLALSTSADVSAPVPGPISTIVSSGFRCEGFDDALNRALVSEEVLAQAFGGIRFF